MILPVVVGIVAAIIPAIVPAIIRGAAGTMRSGLARTRAASRRGRNIIMLRRFNIVWTRVHVRLWRHELRLRLQLRCGVLRNSSRLAGANAGLPRLKR
jgi:hypothetical protein